MNNVMTGHVKVTFDKDVAMLQRAGAILDFKNVADVEIAEICNYLCTF
jgi:hypothetical protein